jgi:hypothetical protein
MEGYRTYIGILVTVAPLALSLFGFTPTPAFNEQFPEAVMGIISLIGAAFATYGRLKAQTAGWLVEAPKQ